MPRAVACLLALALAGGALIAISACGEEDAQLLPGETAREITANLDTVQLLADEGDCIGAESAALQVGEQVEGLGEIDPQLKQALQEGAERLEEVVAGCEEETEAFLPDTTVPEEETAPEEDKEKKEKPEKGKDSEDDGSDEGREEEPAEEEEEPPLPPQAEGEGPGKGKGPPSDEEESSPSGGVSPGSAVGEDD